MFDMFSPPFDSSKLKSRLKMAAGRLDIESSKKTAIMKQNMREIAELLAESPPKESKARLRTEALIRDDNTIAAYDLLKADCQLLCDRVSLIDHCKECPADLLPAISDIMFAAKRVNIKELTTARKQFRRKYGRTFKTKAMHNEGGIINDRIVSNLSLQPVSKETVTTYMEKICKQYEVAWYPTLELKERDIIAPAPIPGIPVVTGLKDTDHQSAYTMQLSRTRNLESLDVLPPPTPCSNGFQKGNHDASSVTSSSSGSSSPGSGGDDAGGGGLLVVAFPCKASESGNSGLVTAQSMPCNTGKSSHVTCF